VPYDESDKDRRYYHGADCFPLSSDYAPHSSSSTSSSSSSRRSLSPLQMQCLRRHILMHPSFLSLKNLFYFFVSTPPSPFPKRDPIVIPPIPRPEHDAHVCYHSAYETVWRAVALLQDFDDDDDDPCP